MQQDLQNLDSPVYGEVTIHIEELGEKKVSNLQGQPIRAVIACVGAALIGEPFLFPTNEWEAGYRAADNTVLVRRRAR